MKDMKELLKKLSSKDEGGEMSENDIQAKMDVLKELLGMASKEAGSDIVGRLKKVTVAAPDDKGIKQGLKKASQMIDSEDEVKEAMNPTDNMKSEYASDDEPSVDEEDQAEADSMDEDDEDDEDFL